MSAMRRVVLTALLAASIVTPAHADWPAQGTIVLDLPAGWTAPKVLRYDVIEDGAGGLFGVWNGGTIQRLAANGSVAPGWPAAGQSVMTQNGTPRVVSDGVGGVYVAAFGGPITISRVTAEGAYAPGWPATGVAISDAGNSVHAPLLASDGTGGAFVAWWEAPVGQTARLVLQRVLADGAIAQSTPLVLSTSPSGPEPVGMIPDGIGGAFVVFATGYQLGQDDLYAQHVSHEMQPLWTAGGVVVSNHGGAQMNPAMVPDGNGGLYVAWADSRYDLTYPYDMRVIVTRLDASGVRNPMWPLVGVHAGLSDTGMGLSPQIVRNADGSIFVGWRSISPGPVAYVQRIQPSGLFAAGWPNTGRPLSTTLNPAANSAELETFAVESAPGGANGVWGFGLVGDGAGGLFATWLEAATVVAQRVGFEAAPAPGWSGDGLVVATSRVEGSRHFEPESPGIVADGFGGAIVAWRARAYVPKYEWDEEIRAAHVLAGGTIVDVGADRAPLSASLALAPNPSAGLFRAAITLADASPARLELFDLQGRRIEEHALAGIGRHVVEFGARTRLPGGVYVARLVTAGRTLTARAAVIR